jgi:nicotinamide-nucleotide adenylyltransferase
MVLDMLGPLDLFVTANGYVKSLLENDYKVVHPASLTKDRIPIDATMVRKAMARSEDWQALVPASIARYLLERNLVERLQLEFGAELCT